MLVPIVIFGRILKSPCWEIEKEIRLGRHVKTTSIKEIKKLAGIPPLLIPGNEFSTH